MDWFYTTYLIFLHGSAAIAFALAALVWRKRSAPRTVPVALLLLAIFTCTLGIGMELSSAYLGTKIFWNKFQWIPPAFTLASLLLGWGIHRFWLFDLLPGARGAIIDGMAGGMVVLDLNHRVVYLNLAASRALGRQPADVIGQPAGQVFAHWPDFPLPGRPGWVEPSPGPAEIRTELALGEGESLRFYELRISSLMDRRGLLSGRLIVWSDVSERRGTEEALRRQLEDLTVLNAVATACASGKSEDELIESVTQILGQTLYTDNFGLLLLDEPAGGLRFHPSYRGLPGESKNEIILLGQGIAGQVASTGISRRISDITSRPGCNPFDLSTCSELAVPVKIGERVIAVINAESSRPDAFSDADERLLVTLAGQIAMSIERLRAEAASRQRFQELLAITRVSREITSVLDLQKVLASIVRHAAELSRSDASGLFTYRPDGLFSLVAAYGVDATFIQAIIEQGVPVEGSAVGRAFSEQRPVQIPDVLNDPSYAVNHLAELQGIRAILALPMIKGNEVVGGIVLWHRQPRRFTAEEEVFLQALAQQSVNAVENARLFEDTQRRLQEVTLLSRVITLTASAEDLPSALNQVCSEVAHFFDSPQTAFALLNPEGTAAEIIAEYQAADHPVVLGLKIPVEGNPSMSYILEHKVPLAISDAQSDPLLAPVHEIMRQREVASILLAPILMGEKVAGTLGIDILQRREFSQADVRLMQDIASQISQALERLNLLAMTQEQARQVQQIMDTVPEGVLLLDSAYRIVLANPAAWHFLSVLEDGFDPNEPLSRLGGWPVEDLCRAHPEALWQELETSGPARRFFEVAASPLESMANKEGLVLVMRDVTQERENQSRVQIQDRLATVGQLAAGIAHDFNNILSAIVVYADLLSMQPDLQPASRERLGIIQQQVQRASSLIRQILDFSRRSVMEPANLDLLPFIKELDRLLGRVLPENIRLELTYQPGIYMVNADPTRLQQVFMNLALNARDAMPSGGTLHFELQRLSIRSERQAPFPGLSPGEWICIRVGDTGTGIPAEVIPYIFDPFFTTKPVGQGTGLGLAQVYGIIQQHGGVIDVISRPGEGTTFMIYLKALQLPEEAELLPEPPLKVLGEGETVLVAEDDQAARVALQALLETQNYRVLAASNGVEALGLFEREEHSIDLVVSDVVMPEMGGVALFQELRRMRPQVKVLFVTGHPLSEENQALLEDSQVRWLQKPFSVKEFTSTLNTLLRDPA